MPHVLTSQRRILCAFVPVQEELSTIQLATSCIAAPLTDNLWNGLIICGMAANKRFLRLQITDKCPECEAEHIDLQALTWAKVRCWQ